MYSYVLNSEAHKRSPRKEKVVRYDPQPRHTKDVIKIVPDAILLSAQHIRIDLPSLSS